MAPSRNLVNGRSPIVNQQRQITSFFTKSSSSTSPSPSPTISKQNPKSNFNLKPKPSPNLSSSPSPSHSPTTPSPHQSKPKKPVLVVGPLTPVTPDNAKKSFGKEVVNKRVKVYWPLDQSWYNGCVKSFDDLTGKHLVQYDDAEEEELDLAKEKIDWVDENLKGFRRLRRVSLVVDDAEDNEVEAVEEKSGGDDDSTDEDWGNSVGNEVVDDGSEDMDLEDEENEDKDVPNVKRLRAIGAVLGKRKMNAGEKLESGKKSKSGGNVDKMGLKLSLNGNGAKVTEPVKNNDSELFRV